MLPAGCGSLRFSSTGDRFGADGNRSPGEGVERGMTMRSRRMRGLWLVAAGAAMVLLVAGCAQGSGAGGGAEAGGSTGSSATAPPRPPSSTGPGRPPTTAAGGNLVVRGTVRQGVEPGCLLLDAQDKRAYLLLDADPLARPGARVEVVGQPADQIVSICGEGTPLSVVSVRALR